MSYALYEPMRDAGRRCPALWRLLFGVLTVIAVSFGWVMAVLWVVAPRDERALAALETGGDRPALTALFLSLIAGLGLGTWIAARTWHKRSLGSLIGRAPRTLRHFTTAALTAWAMMAVMSLPGLMLGEAPVPNLAPRDWLGWLPLALLLVLFQTGSEELFFRGYLQGQLAARFRSPLLWLLPPALIFGLVHFVPTLPGGSATIYVGAAALFGLMAGDLTARTGSLGAAWGFHFANNCVAILLFAPGGSLSGLALYRVGDLADSLSPSPFLIVDLAAMGLVYLFIRRRLTA